MGENLSAEIYDLVLDISRRAARLETSIDELMLDMRALNRDFPRDRQQFAALSQNLIEVSPP